jgi:hypothetical protein
MRRGGKPPAPTRQGLECINCGGTLRYVSNHNCVTCANVRSANQKRARRGEKLLQVGNELRREQERAARNTVAYALAAAYRVRSVFDWRGTIPMTER